MAKRDLKIKLLKTNPKLNEYQIAVYLDKVEHKSAVSFELGEKVVVGLCGKDKIGYKVPKKISCHVFLENREKEIRESYESFSNEIKSLVTYTDFKKEVLRKISVSNKNFMVISTYCIPLETPMFLAISKKEEPTNSYQGIIYIMDYSKPIMLGVDKTTSVDSFKRAVIDDYLGEIGYKISLQVFDTNKLDEIFNKAISDLFDGHNNYNFKDYHQLTPLLEEDDFSKFFKRYVNRNVE